eukprot:maker-scaffold464_size163657-snap-gene-0.35 protein:Tk05274 transcript:maker-scaffold464_size163657-snap-gene-0.35-mRNA-1 annotation:"myb-like protein x-like"
MLLTVHQLLSDARRLSTRLREHDSAADTVLSSAQATLKEIEAMKQYQEDLERLNAIAHHRPRAQLVLGIQQENRHIRQLQQENKELRAALEEHQNAIELIMSKYRQHVNLLVHTTQIDRHLVNREKTRMLQDKTDQILEMAGVMQNSIRIDDEHQVRDQEIRTRLLTENKGLRELLEISRRNGSATRPLLEPKCVSRQCQTDSPGLEATPTGEPDVDRPQTPIVDKSLCTSLAHPTHSVGEVNGHASVEPALLRTVSLTPTNQTPSPTSSPVGALMVQSSDDDLVSSDEEIIFNTIKRTPAKAQSDSQVWPVVQINGSKDSGAGGVRNGHHHLEDTTSNSNTTTVQVNDEPSGEPINGSNLPQSIDSDEDASPETGPPPKSQSPSSVDPDEASSPA